MLVDNSVYRNAYDAPGNARTFTISFPFLDASHIAVYQKIGDEEEVKVPASQYTISGAGGPGGGTLTMNTAPAAGTKIVILRDIPITQLYNYTELDNFPAESHENALAKLTMICQQLMELANRHLAVPATSTQTPQEAMREILDIADKANEYAEKAQQTYEAAVALKDTVHEYVIQSGDEQVERIDAAGDAEVQDVESTGTSWQNTIILEGESQLARLDGFANVGGLEMGLACAMQVWTLTEDVPAGSTIVLPNELRYVPKRHHLWLSYGGMVLSPTFFEEVGDGTATSTEFITKIPFKAGQELTAWVIPLGKAYEMELTDRIVALEDALADLSRRVVYADATNNANMETIE